MYIPITLTEQQATDLIVALSTANDHDDKRYSVFGKDDQRFIAAKELNARREDLIDFIRQARGRALGH